MKKSKIIALLIFAFIFLVPFQMLYFTDEIVNTGSHLLMMFSTIIGFIVAFAIGTNERFDRQAGAKYNSTAHSSSERKAA